MMVFLKREKKAELTTQQIVGLIVLIVSFSVILFLIFRLNLGQTTNKEICHNSVVLKSKSGVFGGALDCRTSYVCISGGGECSGMAITDTVKVKSDDKNEILKVIANEMADCWWMFGEGKIDYGGLTASKTCALCSKIAFDSSLNSLKISYQDLYDFMNKEKKDDAHTYLQYLGIKDAKGLGSSDPATLFDFSKQYYVLTGATGLPGTGTIYFPASILGDVSEAKCDEFVTKA